MQIKSFRLALFTVTTVVAFALASCASHEKPAASAPSQPEPNLATAPPFPVAPAPAPAPVPPLSAAAPQPIVPAPQAEAPAPPPVVPAAPPVTPGPPIPNPADLPADVIAWDSPDKSVTVNFGEATAKYEFSVTNVSSAPVTVVAVTTSCGCTTAQMPPMPWAIPAGQSGKFAVNMNLAGKNGTVIKTVTFATDKGTKHLLVRTTIKPMETSAQMAPGSRETNQRMALADRQAVFKGECASCHADVAKDKMGKELYTAACGICHEAEHRASMVPDLHVAKQERNEEYWRSWIANGRQGSLMPAFALPAGGILNDAQILSLVAYLATNMPAKPVTGASVAVPH